jgi:hypothetical protein
VYASDERRKSGLPKWHMRDRMTKGSVCGVGWMREVHVVSHVP